MRYIALLAVAASATLAACGGGSAGGGTGGNYAVPQPAPTASSASSVLQTQTLNGGPAFVTASGMPVYTFGGDTTANQSACTGSCLQVWPAVVASAGTLPAPWSSFTRADNGQLQLSYKGQALYTFV
ncbi:MAG TPA: hypothetical protein VGN14_17325, partial [Candidatus Elarobacter sp.]